MKKFTLGLKDQFAVGISCVVLLVIGGVAGMMSFSEYRLLRNEMHRHHLELVKRLGRIYEESLYQNEIVFLNYLKSLENERGFVAAAFVNNQHQIQMHSEPPLIGSTYEGPNPDLRLSREPVESAVYQGQKGARRIDFIQPVFFGGSPVGAVHLIFAPDELERFLFQSLSSSLKRVGAISLLALSLGLLGAYIMARRLVRPIQSVVNGMRSVAQGDLRPLPASERRDELGWMTEELNVMVQKLKELEEMKREFVASVTHEFRSPLTAIERFVSLLMKGHYGSLNSDQRESLMIVQNNSVRLNNFVDNLLTVSKLETSRIDVFCEAFDVRGLIQEAITLYKPLASEKGLVLESLLAATSLRVWADKGKVTQILSNLISNAIKFTDKGEIRIKAAENTSHIEVIVSDTGIGIPPQDQDKIFSKFYRSPAISHKVKGTGLGLSIVKGFLEAQGGTIRFANNPQGGTSFLFTLPKPSV